MGSCPAARRLHIQPNIAIAKVEARAVLGRFSMIDTKVMLATFLAKARFELPEGEVPVPLARITLRPKHGLKLKVTMLH